MKIPLVCIIFFSISLTLFGQTNSLSQFNFLICNSTLAYVKKDYNSCLQKVIEAQQYGELRPHSHLILAECYLNLNDTNKAIVEIEKSILKGVTEETLRNYFPLFKMPNGNLKWTSLVNNYPKYRAQYNSTLDWDVKVILEQIIARDQAIRINEREYSNIGCKIENLHKIVDSINYSEFINLIVENGFPTYKKVGYYSKLEILFAHWIMDDSRYNKLNELMLNAIENGNFSPDDYAWIIDRRLIWKNFGKALYGGYEDPESYGEIDDIANVDKRRSQIFLPSLELDSKITNRSLPKNYIPKSK